MPVIVVEAGVRVEEVVGDEQPLQPGQMRRFEQGKQARIPDRLAPEVEGGQARGMRGSCEVRDLASYVPTCRGVAVSDRSWVGEAKPTKTGEPRRIKPSCEPRRINAFVQVDTIRIATRSEIEGREPRTRRQDRDQADFHGLTPVHAERSEMSVKLTDLSVYGCESVKLSIDPGSPVDELLKLLGPAPHDAKVCQAHLVW
jgi:hypothetical protein